jgi:radical SAM enzyme (TIGR01210 family)
MMSPYPAGAAARDRFVLDRRPPRQLHDPWRSQGLLVEDERTADHTVERVATLFLTGRECPWRCAMCDLWQHTIAEDTPVGALPRQLDLALEPLTARPGVIKLYNASSFFDPRAVPVADYDGIARRLASFAHVVVESHPALVRDRVDRLLEALARHRGVSAPKIQLEVAMGLETADPVALARLHKGMTLELFARATGDLLRRGVAARAFLLVPPPFVAPAEEAVALRRSIEFALTAGVSVVSLIPTRTGNGALEALAQQGHFRSPRLADLERALEESLPEARGRVFADLWDLERLGECPACLPARRERLREMNLLQVVRPGVVCPRCGLGRAA